MINEYSRKLKEEALERAKLVAKLRDEGLSYKEITEKTGITKRRIGTYLKKLGKTNLKTEDRSGEIKELYDKGYTSKKISESLGIHYSIVRDYLANNGLETNFIKLRYEKDLEKVKLYIEDGEVDVNKAREESGLTENRILNIIKKEGFKQKKRIGGKKHTMKTCVCGNISTRKYCSSSCYYQENKSFIERFSDEWFDSKLKSIKASASKRGLDFNLSVSYIRFLYDMSDYKCVYSGDDYGDEYNSFPSLDRFDNERGYVIGNVIPCTVKWNAIKGNLDTNEMMEYVPLHFDRGLAFLKSLRDIMEIQS